MKYYLAHHGVQNQHWGVRHGPPYPLDSNTSKQAKRKRMSQSDYEKLYGDKSIITRKNILLNKKNNRTITVGELRELNNILSEQGRYAQIKSQSKKAPLVNTSDVLKRMASIIASTYAIKKSAKAIIQTVHDRFM